MAYTGACKLTRSQTDMQIGIQLLSDRHADKQTDIQVDQAGRQTNAYRQTDRRTDIQAGEAGKQTDK
jgi:hypothetical protein